MDKLYEMLQQLKWPNCTLYIIWHYVSRGMINEARAEYKLDCDKLPSGCKLQVAQILGVD